ncbi:MAG: hypothetical protein N3E38_02450 [Candidatus Aenigmarchaeota archaeon]|nr:hypothetical protein [Candidatus Aenigmarchaeota archaeon]
MSRQKDPYYGTTASSLDHHFRNHIVLAQRSLQSGCKNGFYRHLWDFAEGLTRALGLPEYGGVRRQDLEEMIELARSDLPPCQILDELYRRYNNIRKNIQKDKI